MEGRSDRAVGPVAEYLDLLEASRVPPPAEAPLRRIGRRVVPRQLRLRARRRATAAVAARERRRAAALAARRPVRLHLGSGGVRKQGWVDVDLVGDSVDLAWNLTQPLPFPDGGVDAIFHEHYLTVLPLARAFRQLCDSRRVLRPGGVLRIGVPNPWKDSSELADRVGLEGIPRLLAMQEVFYYPGNHSMYDLESLSLLLRAAGFDHVEERRFGESRLEPCPDSPHRRDWTLYVEAV